MKRLKKINIKAIEQLRSAMYRSNYCNVLDLFAPDSTRGLDNLISLAREHHKLAEVYCNGDLTEKQVKRQEKIEKVIITQAKVFGLTAHFDGDPRGFTVKLHSPNKNMYNTWGGAESGYGI